MSPITYDEAYNATNPDNTDEQRKQSALAIVAGTAANEAYWNSRSDLEALKAQADGHGIVARDASSNPPTGSAAPTASGGAIEGTVVSDSLSPSTESSESTPDTEGKGEDNSESAAQTLRKQLEAAGIHPEA